MNSKHKGNRFELKVSKLLSKAFNRKLRRTPLSGGHEIESDIYDVERGDFLYFIECKHQSSFRFNSIITGKSKLFDFHKKAEKQALRSKQAEKYNEAPIPIIIFRGGDFKTDMVMYDMHDTPIFHYTEKFNLVMQKGKYIFTTLTDFLNYCNTDNLT